MINQFDITDDTQHLAIVGNTVYAIVQMTDTDVTVLPLPDDDYSLLSAEWMRGYAEAHDLSVMMDAVLTDLGIEALYENQI